VLVDDIADRALVLRRYLLLGQRESAYAVGLPLVGRRRTGVLLLRKEAQVAPASLGPVRRV
jgi:hypothetical protein